MEHAEGGGNDRDDCVEAPPEVATVSTAQEAEHAAHFAPSNRWRRPSDYIKHYMERFEQGLTTPKG